MILYNTGINSFKELLTIVVFVILCFCGDNAIVFQWTLRLHLSFTSDTRYQWQIPWRSSGQWRITQLQKELALINYACPYNMNQRS